MIMDSATPGGRHIGGGGAASKGKGNKAGGAVGGSAASGEGAADGGGGDTLELLAARPLLHAVMLGDVSQQLLPLTKALTSPASGQGHNRGAGDEEDDAMGGRGGDEAVPDSEQQEGDGGARGDRAGRGEAPGGGQQRVPGQQLRMQGCVDSERELASALAPLLQQLQGCVDSLMRAGCFKAAHVVVQCLLLLGRRMAAAEAALSAAAAAAAAPAGRQPQQQKQQQEQGAGAGAGAGTGSTAAEVVTAAAAAARQAVQALSLWGRQACQQREPAVAHLGLVKALLEVVVRFSSESRGLARAARETHSYTAATLPYGCGGRNLLFAQHKRGCADLNTALVDLLWPKRATHAFMHLMPHAMQGTTMTWHLCLLWQMTSCGWWEMCSMRVSPRR